MKNHQIVKSNRWLLALAFAVFASLIAWAAYSEVAQISRAPGQVIASARTQVIQSANDGVLESILVLEGERVKKGQILARMERSQAEAALHDSQGKVAALKAALTRLEAEVFNRPLVFSNDVKAYPAFITNQTELYQRRREALNAELGALEKSLSLVKEELSLSQPLLASGDIGKAEIIRLQRQVAELTGQITVRRNKYFQDAQAEMTKYEEELNTQKQMLADRTTMFERTDLVAPADGLVKNIQITTPGAKLRPGDVVMELVPTGSLLIMEVKLKPTDIAFVQPNLPAAIKLDTYDYSIYGVLHGKVHYVSPDALSERTASGEQTYYRAHIRIDQDEVLAHNKSHPAKPIEIQPGMTGTVEIRTGQNTVLSYLTKPVTKTFAESMSER